MNKARDFWKSHRKNLVIYIVLAMVATLFIFLFSLSTSPIYSGYLSYTGVHDGGDSPHFMTDGQNWLNGRIPYRDTFDHKGPIIYLVNMIGMWLGGGSRYGIIVLQIISLTITLIFAWKISQQAKKSYLWGGISIGLMLLFMVGGYSAGNTVQEYNLPFLMIATYFLVKYFYQKKPGEHNPWWAFAYGIAIGSCLLLQLTHAIIVCVGILVIMIMLIAQKRWKNLWVNLGMGLAGIAIMWIPFALYFLLNGALGDFIYCTITFNFSYATKIGSWLHGMTGADIWYFLTTFVPFFCVGIAAILAFARRKKAYATMLLLTFLLEAYLFLSAENYPQYALATIFQVSLFLNEVILFERKDEVRNFAFVGMVGILAAMTYNQILERSSALVDQYNAIRKAEVEGVGYEELMEKYLPEIKKTSFTAFGDNALKGIYAKYNLVSPNKVPLIQNWLAAFSEKVNHEIHEDFEENRANYILAEERFVRDKDYGIGDILDKYYQKIDSDKNNRYVIYQLKETR